MKELQEMVVQVVVELTQQQVQVQPIKVLMEVNLLIQVVVVEEQAKQVVLTELVTVEMV